MNNKEQEIISDIRELDDKNMVAAVRQLNTVENVKHFNNLKVDMPTVLKKLVILLLEKRINIPTGGYYNLRSYIEKKEKKK